MYKIKRREKRKRQEGRARMPSAVWPLGGPQWLRVAGVLGTCKERGRHRETGGGLEGLAKPFLLCPVGSGSSTNSPVFHVVVLELRWRMDRERCPGAVKYVLKVPETGALQKAPGPEGLQPPGPAQARPSLSSSLHNIVTTAACAPQSVGCCGG